MVQLIWYKTITLTVDVADVTGEMKMKQCSKGLSTHQPLPATWR
jgi:hypothetical protein